MYYSEIEGGKIKSLKETTRDINRGFKKSIAAPLKTKVFRPANKQFFDPALREAGKAGTQIGKFTNKELLPAAVTIGIPIASASLSALGAMYGIPPELTYKLSETVLKEAIPDKYQSDNKYVGMFSEAINMGLSGDPNPQEMESLGKRFATTAYSDIDRKYINRTSSQSQYNPEDPHQDLIQQLMNKYPGYQQQFQSQISQNVPQVQQYQPSQATEQTNDNINYSNSQIDESGDTLTMETSPYDQKTGNEMGLLGAGLKKKKSKKKPTKKIIKEVYVKTMPSYKKFSHAKNAALDQLLEAKAEKEEREARRAMIDVSKQMKESMDTLKNERDFYKEALGAGIKKKRGRPRKIQL